MSNRLAEPILQFFDNSGEPLSGGFLNFYLTTTSTRASTFQNSALTIANSNPVELDSAGRSGNIFLNGSVTYKAVLTDANGVTIWTADPVVDLAANITASVQVFAGNPNGSIAGNAGTPGSTGASLVYDITNGILYICTSTGIATTAVWTAISNSFTAGEDIYTSNQTITAANKGRIATANSAGAITFALTAAATIGVGLFGFKNIGAGALTVDPAGAELIEGVTTLVIGQNQGCIAYCTGSTWRVLSFFKSTDFPPEVTVASATTTDILGAASEAVAVSGSVAITSFGSAPNRLRRVRFTGAPLLTYNATTLILPNAANVQAAAGDTAVVQSDASGNARVVSYQKASGAPITFGSGVASFSANKNAVNQSINSGATTKVTFTTEAWDTGGFYDAPNSKWTPPAGVVMISAACQSFAADQKISTIHLYKNGALYQSGSQLQTSTAGTSTFIAIGSWLSQANGTDFFEIYFTNGDGSAQNVVGTATFTYFQGTLV